MQKVLAYISSRGRYDTTLAMAMTSIALQSHKPDKFILFDDNDEPKDLRTISLYQHVLQLFNEKGIPWEVTYGQKAGQHRNHESANMLGFDLCWRLDDDEFAQSDVLEILLSNMTDEVGAVGGCVLIPNRATEEPPVMGAYNSIGDFMTHPNIQWFRIKEKIEVDHLYSSFLYRAGIVHYNLNLSRVAHTEETQFTYELKRKGYKILVDPKAVTYHFREPTGGIRDNTKRELWTHDEELFQRKLVEWGVNGKSSKLVVLDNGIGDHICFKSILPKLKEKYDEVVIACCYPFVFEGEKVISISEAKEMTDIDGYNIYRWMWDRNWKTSIVDAFTGMYL